MTEKSKHNSKTVRKNSSQGHKGSQVARKGQKGPKGPKGLKGLLDTILLIKNGL
jgi:hypothetical protein